MEKFEREYHIRSYECDKSGQLRLVTLMNILQDMADSHASKLGLGYDFCVHNGYAWFGSNYHIKIERLPQCHEQIRIQTWPAEKKKLGVIRDFAIFDQDNHCIIRASSLWILIDFARKRPIAIEKAIPDYHPLEERSLATDFQKLPPIETVHHTKVFQARYDDIDFNNHVNNAIYPLWAVETSSPEFHDSHFPAEIEIFYKKECHLDEMVEVLVQETNQACLYLIKSRTDDRELAQLKIIWQNKD